MSEPYDSQAYIFSIDAIQSRQREIITHHEKFGHARFSYFDRHAYFFRAVGKLFKFLVEPRSKVLFLGCQNAPLLEAVEPEIGVGIDASNIFVEAAEKRFPDMEFFTQSLDGSTDGMGASHGVFDYILIGNAGEAADLQGQLSLVQRHASAKTRFVLYKYNHLWEPVLRLAERQGLRYPTPAQNWFSMGDVRNILYLADMEVVKVHRSVILPVYIPLISTALNFLFQSLPVINRLCLLEVVVAKIAAPRTSGAVSVSVVIPCRNEEGNIENAVLRIPELGNHTEILFCDDKSTDNTRDLVLAMQEQYPDKDIKLIDGPGISKSENVWNGFDRAGGDILIILDGDLTVMPEQLPQFVAALTEGKGEFINGSRMIYPMEDDAMRILNQFGNKFFSYLFTLILGQKISDTLCGTKVIWREDWPRIKQYVGCWGKRDLWGDFDLLFSAAKLNLKITEMPVHYRDRISGDSKMTGRLKNAWRMFQMCYHGFIAFGSFRISRKISPWTPLDR